MSGIEEIISARRFPGFIVRSGKTEQRELEDESAKQILKRCRYEEEKHGMGFMRTSGMRDRTVKEVWETELADPRKNSITERYDDRMCYGAEIAHKMEEQDGIPTIGI